MNTEIKSLRTEQLVSLLRSHFDSLDDPRSKDNVTYSKIDFILSAFSIFYVQNPSWLSSRTRMKSKEGRHNLHSLFGSFSIPSDTQTKTFLDSFSPEDFALPFHSLFQKLQQIGILKKFLSSQSSHLLALDGIEYFSSQKISCQNCTKKHYEKKVEILSFDSNSQYEDALRNSISP